VQFEVLNAKTSVNKPLPRMFVFIQHWIFNARYLLQDIGSSV